MPKLLIMIGEKIKYYCKKDGRKEQIIAKEIGIIPGYLSELYQKKSIQTELLERIAGVLQLPIVVFFEPLPDEKETNNLTTAHEPKPHYYKQPPNDGENEALRELVRTQRELIEQLKTAGGAAYDEKDPNHSKPKKPATA